MWKRVVASVVLVACEKSTPSPAPVPDVDLALVSTELSAVPDAPKVTVSKTAVIVGGTPVVAIANGKVDAGDLEGGASGMGIPKLRAALGAQAKNDTLVLALDRTTPYQLLIDVMFTAKSQAVAIRRFAILARTPATTVPTALIVALPDSAAQAGGARPANAEVAALGGGQRRGPVGRISADVAGGEGNSLTRDIVLAKIQAAYMAALKRCYTAELARDASAHGMLKLHFSVDDAGRVTDAHADGVAAACVAPQMQTWRFRVPTPAPASFDVALKLVADDTPTEPALSTQVAQASAEQPEASPRLGLMVSTSATELLLWSTSGMVGTLQAPKLRLPLADGDAPTKLRAALAEVAKQVLRGSAPPDTHTIVFMGSQDLPAATFIPVMAAMQAEFPDLLLAVAR